MAVSVGIRVGAILGGIGGLFERVEDTAAGYVAGFFGVLFISTCQLSSAGLTRTQPDGSGMDKHTI